MTVFTQLNAILRERRVSIFSLSQGKMIHLTLTEGATGNTLLYMLAKVSCFFIRCLIKIRKWLMMTIL